MKRNCVGVCVERKWRVQSRVLLGVCLTACLLGVTCGAWAQGQGKQEVASGEWRVASVPRLIKYRGRLKDGKGATKSGVAGLTFAIYAEQEGGAPLWMETQNVTFEEGGKYTVLLGANSSEGVPAELFTNQWRVASGEWREREKDNAETQSSQRSAEQERSLAALGMTTGEGQERWLGVEGPDIQETPRVLLVSVPYALKAADAETLGGLPASAFVMKGERGFGINTEGTENTEGAEGGRKADPSPTSQSTGRVRDDRNAGTAAGLKPGPYKGGTKGATAAKSAATSATDNDFVSKFDTNANLVPSAIYESNGSVGIGTTSPAAALHVNGDTLLVNSGTTAQVRVNGPASSGRFGQDANGTFLANDTSGSALRFLTSNSSNLNEWMRIGSTGSVNIGSAQAAQFGEAVFARDDLDSVHSYIAQAGSQYHFRLSSATPDVAGFKDLLIVPYTYGMAIEYPGTLELWSGSLSVHNNPRCPWCGPGPNFWVDDDIDSGGLYVTALDNGGGAKSNVVLAADRYGHSSHGSLNFVVRNPTDAFKFDVGPFGAEAMKGQISGTATASSLDLFSGTVQATVRAQGGAPSGAATGSGQAAGGTAALGTSVQFGSTSNDAVSLFTNNGAARATLFPSGNFSLGNSADTAPLAVGTAAQFQVSAAGAVTIGGGTPIKQHLSVMAALAFAGLDGFSCNTVTVPVNGAAEGDAVALGMPNALGALDGVTWFGWVSGAGVVSIRGCNATPHKLAAPAAANVRVDVWQH